MESEKSILVVDDNAINREVLREILKNRIFGPGGRKW